MGKLSSIVDRVICPRHDNGRVLSFNVFINTFIVNCREKIHKINTGHYGNFFYCSTSKVEFE